MATNTGLPSFTIRSITPSETHSLRHRVLWPHKPLSYVQLDEDDQGHHFGVFIEPGDTPIPAVGEEENKKESPAEQQQQQKAEPVSIISLFFAEDAGEDEGDQSQEEEKKKKKKKKEARFRKFATDPRWQGRGVGSALLRYTIVFAVTEGAEYIWCDARTSALGFYQRFGLDAEGDEFFKGDVPYRKMSRTLP